MVAHERRGVCSPTCSATTCRSRSSPTTAPRFGPSDARTTIVVRSPDALRRIVTAPDELGFGRAYVAGELEVDGDIFDVMAVANYIEELQLGPRRSSAAAKLVGWKGLKPLAAAARGGAPARPAPLASSATPPRSRTTTTCRTTSTGWCSGRRSRTRARCGTTTPPRSRTRRRTSTSSSAASSASSPGCGCSTSGAGGAGCCCTRPSTTACSAVGVTLSQPQAELARKRVAERGLGDRVEVRHADFRDVDDGPYDAISSIGMFEHVGLIRARRATSRGVTRCSRPEGRLLNHGISRPAPRGQDAPPPLGAGVGWAGASPSATCSPTASCTRSATSCPRSSAPGSRPATWRACASTTRSRCGAGCATSRPTGTPRSPRSAPGRARVWRLYMAAAAVGFEHDDNQVHQVLATATTDGASGMPLRPRFT